MIGDWVTRVPRGDTASGNVFLGSAEVARRKKAADQACRKKTRNAFANERAGGIDLEEEGAGSAGEDSPYGSQDGFSVKASGDQESATSTSSDEDDFPQISDVKPATTAEATPAATAEGPASARKRSRANVVVDTEEEDSEEAADDKPAKKKKRAKSDFTDPNYWTVLRTRVLTTVRGSTRPLTVLGIQQALTSRFHASAARRSIKKNVEQAWSLGIFDVKIKKGARMYLLKKGIESSLAVKTASKADATRVLGGRRSAFQPDQVDQNEATHAPVSADTFAQLQRLATREAVRAVEANPKIILLEQQVRLLRQTLKVQDEYARRIRGDLNALRSKPPRAVEDSGKLEQSQRDRARMSREIALLKKQLRGKHTS